MVARVVKDLVGPFSGLNHVVYMDNYFTSGPLVEELAQLFAYSASDIKFCPVGFPEGLKSVKLSKGNYACERVGDMRYYVFEDRSRVSFVSNVFPEAMETQVVRGSGSPPLLCRVGEVGISKGKCRHCLDVGQTSSSSHHLCLVFLLFCVG